MVQQQQLISYLQQFVTAGKQHKIAALLALRTRHITIVLEELYQSHNASAALRSAECFGVQDAHIIDPNRSFTLAPNIAKGAAQWLTVHKYTQMQACYTALKAAGYTIVATSLHPNALTIQELPLDNKIALVFGTERRGLSADALSHADAFVTIPMVGFTQSFNVSVAAGICLYELTTRLRKSPVIWQLTDQEKEDLTLVWLRKSLIHHRQLEKYFLQQL